MRTIDPNTIYTVAEVGEIIHGIVNIEMLRRHGGLVSLPGAGYWGADLILAINRMQAQRRLNRGYEPPAPSEPAQKTKATSQPRTAPKSSSRPVENQRTKFRRLIEMRKKEQSEN